VTGKKGNLTRLVPESIIILVMEKMQWDSHLYGENLGLVGPCVKERSSYAMSIPCAVAVSMSDLRKIIMRMSE